MRTKNKLVIKELRDEIESLKNKVSKLQENISSQEEIIKFCNEYPQRVHIEVASKYGLWSCSIDKTVTAHIFNYHTGKLEHLKLFEFDSSYKDVSVKKRTLICDEVGTPRNFEFRITFTYEDSDEKCNPYKSVMMSEGSYVDICLDLDIETQFRIIKWNNLPKGFKFTNKVLPIEF